MVIPLTARTAAGRREQLVEAEIWADVGVSAAVDRWADYDPEAVAAGLQQARGALKGVDPADLLEDLREARAQDSPTRPE